MNGDVVVRAEALGKKYVIGHESERERYTALRDIISRKANALLRATADMLRGRAVVAGDTTEEFWALRDVNFEIRRGEVVGVIGPNGAGKSTLLKVLSRITEPTEGRVTIEGRVTSLLEVGTGFHPELTGRENIYLNGAILGMRRAEIRRKFDEIVAFAEVERFLDTPVKRYSSGMYVRLAFAVAAHLEPEILVVDEVLAVGDVEFQKKCLGKMDDVARSGRTVLFVSHSMAAVQKLCPRAILLRDGRIFLDGEAAQSIRTYMGQGAVAGRLNLERRHIRPDRVAICNAWLETKGQKTSSLLFGDSPTLMIEVEVQEPTTFSVELILRQADGVPVAFAPSGLAQDWQITAERGLTVIHAKLPSVKLAIGRYSIDLMLAEAGIRFFDLIESAITFNIDGAAIGKKNWSFTQRSGQGHELWDVRFGIENPPLAFGESNATAETITMAKIGSL